MKIKYSYLHSLYFFTVNSKILTCTWDYDDSVNAGWSYSNSLAMTQTACQTCQDLRCKGEVGIDNKPDEHGETTQDGMVLDGKTMNIGSVASLRFVEDVVGVARGFGSNFAHFIERRFK